MIKDITSGKLRYIVFLQNILYVNKKIKKATSVLTHYALSWWECLTPSDKPQTWTDLKILMRETFINTTPELISTNKVHHLVDHIVVIPLTVTNLCRIIYKSERMMLKKMRCS
jgi:hypothetical protein